MSFIPFTFDRTVPGFGRLLGRTLMSCLLVRSSSALAFAVLLTTAPTPSLASGFEQRGEASAAGAELVLRALSLLGVNYKFGGSSPDTGLDCSGLVRHVFREAAGLGLPRRSVDISKAGEVIRKDELKPGDLVFFNTLRRAFSHVGIYIGNGQFVHAPSRGGGVRVEDMSDRYWRKRFNGARRMLSANEASPPQEPHSQFSLLPAVQPAGWSGDIATADGSGAFASTQPVETQALPSLPRSLADELAPKTEPAGFMQLYLN
jgi:hypothetical protein